MSKRNVREEVETDKKDWEVFCQNAVGDSLLVNAGAQSSPKHANHITYSGKRHRCLEDIF